MSCGASSAGSPKSVTCHFGQKGPEGGRGLVTAASIHYLHPLPAHYLHLLTHTGRGHIAQCMTKVLSQINSFLDYLLSVIPMHFNISKCSFCWHFLTSRLTHFTLNLPLLPPSWQMYQYPRINNQVAVLWQTELEINLQ